MRGGVRGQKDDQRARAWAQWLGGLQVHRPDGCWAGWQVADQAARSHVCPTWSRSAQEEALLGPSFIGMKTVQFLSVQLTEARPLPG